MMIFKLFFLVCMLPALKCSLVIDSGKQQGIYLNNYCPSMKYCPEGSHVMCMYYNPRQVLGPLCSNALNVSITPDLAEKLLDISNAIRSKIARGKEKGKDGHNFPRGYGIFRLKWDSELATFAQVLANQCVLRHDMCRATKRFPFPGQTAGLVRFTYPDWYPLSKSVNFTTPGFYGAKLQYATIQSLKSWYGQKNTVTKNMIVTYPDWTKVNAKDGRSYLDMIYGPATHMGCGISAYTEYAVYDKKIDLNYNSVQIICNFSARPHTGAAVYNTVPPSDTDIPASNCGCPAGSYGDSDCLCQYKLENQQLSAKTRSCNGASCEPTVVLLPIFTTEDTTPERIYNSLTNMSKSMQKSSIEIKDIFDILPGKHNYLRDQNKNKHLSSKKRFTVVHNPQPNFISSVKNRYFDKKYEPELSEDRYRQSRRPTENHVPKKTSSIFTRVTRFVLPTKHSKIRDYNNVKRDVVPRKDFSNAKKLVDKYIYGNDNLFKPKMDIKPQYEEPSDMHRNRKESKHSKEDLLDLKDTTLTQAEQSIIHHNEHENDLQKESIYREPIESVTLQTDSKLMSLLDTLEKEVKHIELHDKDKEIFDKKIRKIYGKIVGKSVGSLTHDPETVKPATRHKSQSKSSNNIFNVEEILDKHEFQNNNNIHKSFEQYDEPTTIEQHTQKKLRDRNKYRNEDETKTYITKTSYRDIEHNEINSQEHKYDDFDFNNYRINPFKDHYTRRSASRIENLDEHRNMHKNYYINQDRDRDPMSLERRKYYQEKLDNMERRLSRARTHKRHRAPEERHMRAMLPHSTRKSENHMEPFYVADRARFLHGY